jgi:subtilisin-like proprotein convertase family protein
VSYHRAEWKLQVIDNNSTQLEGMWNDWKLNLYGLKLDQSPKVVANTKDSGSGS